MKKIQILLLVMFSLLIVGCSSKPSTKDVDINKIHTAIKELYGDDYLPSMLLTEDEIEGFIGVSNDDIEAAIVEVPMISTHVDTFVAIQAKEGRADAVEKALNDHRTTIVEHGFAYPMNVPKLNASKVIRHGDYVFFVMLGAYNDDMDATESEQMIFAQDEVKKAEDAIAEFFN